MIRLWSALQSIAGRMFGHGDLDEALGLDDLTRLARGIPLPQETAPLPQTPPRSPDTMQIASRRAPAPPGPRSAPRPRPPKRDLPPGMQPPADLAVLSSEFPPVESDIFGVFDPPAGTGDDLDRAALSAEDYFDPPVPFGDVSEPEVSAEPAPAVLFLVDPAAETATSTLELEQHPPPARSTLEIASAVEGSRKRRVEIEEAPPRPVVRLLDPRGREDLFEDIEDLPGASDSFEAAIGPRGEGPKPPVRGTLDITGDRPQRG